MSLVIKKAVLICLLFSCLVVPGNAKPTLETFDEVWQLVDSHFYRSDLNGVDAQKLRAHFLERLSHSRDELETAETINESLRELQASHTRYYSNREPAYYELLDIFARSHMAEQVKPLFGGEFPRYEGILVVTEDGLVTDLVPGGPAYTSGLRWGDIVLTVDGRDFHPIESFRERSGEELTVKVQRGTATLKLSVVPDLIYPQEAFLKTLTDSVRLHQQGPYKIAYVRVWSYGGEVYHEALLSALKGPLKEADGLVLDLRGSWGGAQPKYLDSFASTPGLELTGRDGDIFKLEGASWNKPLAVLIDRTVSSGKELLAEGLSRSGRSMLVGETTAGAVLAGQLHLLSEGALYVAASSVTVDGKTLESRGVAPHHYFSREDVLTVKGDRLPGIGRELLTWSMIRAELLQRDNRARGGQRVQVHMENSEFLKKVLDTAGWPKQDLIGRQALEAAHRIVEDSKDKELQERVRELTRKPPCAVPSLKLSGKPAGSSGNSFYDSHSRRTHQFGPAGLRARRRR